MKLSAGEIYLSKTDSTLKSLIEEHGHLKLKRGEDYFESLASSIISQQISVKAASKIWQRFLNVTHLDPTRVLFLDGKDVKEIGLSRQKLAYLQDLADHFYIEKNTFDHLEQLKDGEVVEQLTKVKGVGVWTAQMFLIFTLGRQDIFAPDDRGLQIAIKNNYKKDFNRKDLVIFASRWAPYRSSASLHLWRSLNNKPT